MNDITFQKICKEFSNVCIQKEQKIKVSKGYITAERLEAYCLAEARNIAEKYKNQMTQEQQLEFQNFYLNYIDSFVQDYDRYLTDNNIVGKNIESIDVDPVTVNGHTFYNGKRSEVFSDYLGTNSAYSASDMVASITIQTEYGTISTILGSIQTLSYSTHQEKFPVRCLSNMNPKDWVFGPRTIAGSLVFAVFNKHWIMDIYDNLKEKAGMKNWHFLTDEIPPFDVTISFANEYGFDSRLALYGIRILEEGQTMSTNDIYIENTYQFVATDIELMDSLDAYQTGGDRHKSLLITSSASSSEQDGTIVNPIDKDNEETSGSSSLEFDESVFELSDEELAKIDKSTALKELKALCDKYINSTSDPEEIQRIGLAYNKAYDRYVAFYQKLELEKLQVI